MDDLDEYLQQYERIALGQSWERAEWETALSMCLIGEALQVLGRIPASDSIDYEKVKNPFLQRFRLTAEGIREKFRSATHEDSETAEQLSCRLAIYFDRWLYMSNTETTFENIRDKMATKLLMAWCSQISAIAIKERKLGSLEHRLG